MVRKKQRRKKKPIGFVKTKGKYQLVFGTKSKPKLSNKKFKTKKALTKHIQKIL